MKGTLSLLFSSETCYVRDASKGQRREGQKEKRMQTEVLKKEERMKKKIVDDGRSRGGVGGWG